MKDNRIEIQLEPYDMEIKSKVSVQFDDDTIRMRLHDCEGFITWRFKGPGAINKIERMRVVLDIVEEEIKKRAK